MHPISRIERDLDCHNLSGAHEFVRHADVPVGRGRITARVSKSTDAAPTVREISGARVDREPKDHLAVFRENLLAALADAGKSVPCKTSTQEIARLFEGCSVKSAGRWMANLAGRYPE